MQLIGERVKCALAILPVLNSDATVITGPAVDRLGFDSLVYTALFGATAGGTLVVNSIVFTVTECATVGGTYTATPGTITVSGDPASGESLQFSLDMEPYKRFVKLVATPAITGSGGTMGISASVAMGEAKVLPAV